MNETIPRAIDALRVRDRVVPSIGRAIQVAGRLMSDKAQEHLLYGLVRRLRILHHGLLKIVAVAYPRRKQPLSYAEQLDLSLHLNSFYLHIRGCLDNLAWCLVHELQLFGLEVREDAIASRVNLFGEAFLQKLVSMAPELAVLVRKHVDWQRDLKNIRDPVAHRIPIYAVPAMLSADETERYRSVCQREEAARAIGDLDQTARLLEELDGIGYYVPCFAQLPSDNVSLRKVYPQVADDLSMVLQLADEIIGDLDRRLQQR